MYTGPLDGINWDEIWDRKMELTSFKGEGVEFWNGRARFIDSGSKDSSYADEFLRRMELSPEYSVLDVGCGTGAMSLPLARRVRCVTALDYSPVMLETLKRNAAAEGLNNIVPLNKDWIQTRIGVNVEVHDVVLASRSLPMGNLRKALTLMNKAARCLCYLTWIAGRRETEAKICEILGKEYHPFPEYIIICNMLYSMRIYANVEIFEASGSRRFKNLDEAVTESVKGQNIESSQTEKKLRALLEKELSYHDGCYYQDMTTRWAFIWWRKE